METESLCEFYSELVGVNAALKVSGVEMDDLKYKITIRIEHSKAKIVAGSNCANRTTHYDDRVRVLRYLDICQCETFLEVHVPRIKCKNDGVKQLDVPFSEKHSRFTFRFEKVVLVWLSNCSISKVAETMRLSWEEVDGILQRSVQ